MGPRILDPRWFARGWGALLAVLVGLGIPLEFFTGGRFIDGFLHFDWTHDLLHVLLLGLALYFGFRATARRATLYARTFGVLGLLLGILGFVPPFAEALADGAGWNFEIGENVVHGLVGLWGLAAGFLGKGGGTRRVGGTGG